jgi:hypothetical protein
MPDLRDIAAGRRSPQAARSNLHSGPFVASRLSLNFATLPQDFFHSRRLPSLR